MGVPLQAVTDVDLRSSLREILATEPGFASKWEYVVVDDNMPDAVKSDENKPDDNKPGETKLDDTEPGETKPGDTKPGETKPGDNKPGEDQPNENKPDDSQTNTQDMETDADHQNDTPPLDQVDKGWVETKEEWEQDAGSHWDEWDEESWWWWGSQEAKQEATAEDQNENETPGLSEVECVVEESDDEVVVCYPFRKPAPKKMPKEPDFPPPGCPPPPPAIMPPPPPPAVEPVGCKAPWAAPSRRPDRVVNVDKYGGQRYASGWYWDAQGHRWWPTHGDA